jgi:hypothetical protein
MIANVSRIVATLFIAQITFPQPLKNVF